MARTAYIEKTFKPETIRVIEQVDTLCTAYQQQGYDLTLRQLYYQFVARDLFPDSRTWRWTGSRWVRDPNGTKNADPNYNWLGSIVNDARLAGLLDWGHIVDRTRNLLSHSHWDSPAQIIEAVARSYLEDKWAQQSTYIEVWVEKDALVGVLGDPTTYRGVCPDNDVAWFSCRGYTSQSELYGAARRLQERIEDGKSVVVIHLGDHDPSGIDMSRDIEDRLRMFIAQDLYDAPLLPTGPRSQEEMRAEYESLTGGDLEIERIALNMDQVRQYRPPPNPAKLTDARATGYIERFGPSSWELDALEPTVLVALVQNAIDSYKDPDIWQEAVDLEARRREVLTKASTHWAQVAEFLEGVA